MSNHDELLARLERVSYSPFENKAELCGKAAAAIRDLEAKLEAEHYLRESAQQRALQAEDAAGHIAVKLREIEAALMYAIDCVRSDDGAALAPDRTVPISHADIPYMTIPPKPVISESLTINYPPDRTESAALQENGQLCNAKGTPTAPETRPASAADPVSPLLPGLERAAEICQGVHSACLAINRGTTSADPDHERFQYQANGADECGYTIRAEISRLKGEGSDHE